MAWLRRLFNSAQFCPARKGQHDIEREITFHLAERADDLERVVGVLPADFAFPDREVDLCGPIQPTLRLYEARRTTGGCSGTRASGGSDPARAPNRCMRI